LSTGRHILAAAHCLTDANGNWTRRVQKLYSRLPRLAIHP
jgi:hypothetical protein